MLGRIALPLLASAAATYLLRRSARPACSFRGRTVVITGGSRGLGLVLARQFAAEGARVALLARRAEELARAEASLRAEGATAIGIPCDITQQGEVQAAMARVQEQFGTIDVLINNAGIIQVGPYEQMTIKDFEDAMAVHLFGPLHTTLAVLPAMRQQGSGRIVNITSIGGKLAFPHLLPYTASKFALVGLSDGLRAELRQHKIYVTTVCPGLMRTGSPPNALFKGKHRLEYAWFAISDSMPLLSINAERAARKIIAACRRGAARLIISPQAQAAILLNELFPGVGTEVLSLINRLLPNPGGTRENIRGHQSESPLAPSILTRLSELAAQRNNEVPHVP